MENISLIKIHSLYLKNVFNLYEKMGSYFWDNPIDTNINVFEINTLSISQEAETND